MAVYDDQKHDTGLTPGDQAREDQRTAAGNDLETNWNMDSVTPGHEKGGGGDGKPPAGGGKGTGGGGKKGEMNLAAAAGIMAINDANEAGGAGDGFLDRNIRKLKKLRKYKKLAAGGAVGGTIVAAVIVLFVLVIPLKIEHIINNIQSRFFASSQNAVDGEMRNMLTDYVQKYVLPSYKKCGTTISKNCNVHLTGTSKNPVMNLYKGWADARLENKLAARGIELKFDTASNTWHLKTPTTSAAGDDIGANGQGLEQEFNSRSEVRAALSDAMEKETHWYEMMFRYKVGRLAEEKYGVKRCIIFCNGKDQLASKIADQKTAAKLYLAERVIQPRDQLTFVAIKCLLDTNCAPDKTTSNPCTEGEDCEMNGAPLSDTDREMSTTLQQLAQQFGVEDVAALEKVYNDIAEKGMQQYLIEQVLTVVLGEDAAQAAAGNISDAIPIIGWINLAAQVIKDANDVGPKVKKLAFAVNVAAAVQLFMMWRSYADEIHTGHANTTEVGSMVNAFGPGNSGTSTDPIVGGTAGAEGTPLYANLFDNSAATAPKSATLLGSLLPVKAYAASTTPPASASSTYLCNDGKPVPTGKLVCPEEALGQGNSALNAIHTFLNLPGIDVITVLANIWNDTVGQIFGLVGNLLTFIISPAIKAFDKAPCLVQEATIPGYCTFKTLAQKAAPIIIKAVVSWIIPNPFGTNMSGGRNLDMTVAGGDALGNEHAHNGLGAQQVTATQSAAIINEQQNQAQEIFSHQPFFARMFSTDTPYSLVSRLAMDVPIGFQSSARDAFASLLSNPFGVLSHSFAVLFSGKASAAVAAQADPFNVVQYAYPPGTIPLHPGDYWDQHCSDGAQGAMTQAWNAAAANGPVDPNSGMPVNNTVDPCLLIPATTGSGGGYFDSSLLSTDDLVDVNGNTAATTNSITINNAAAQAVAQKASVNGTKVGYALYNTQGSLLANYNETSPNFGASITKAMLLVAYLNQVGSGNLSSQASTELTNMIEQSDNASANCIYAHLSGNASGCTIANRGQAEAAVNAVAVAAGMGSFQLNDTADNVYVLGQSQITANDFANFFAQIDNLITNSNQRTFGMTLLSNLSPADQTGLLQAGLPGTVYSKEGWKPEAAGAAGAPYIVNQAAQFSSGGTTYGIAVTVSGTANQASGEAIVKSVVQALIQPGTAPTGQ